MLHCGGHLSYLWRHSCHHSGCCLCPDDVSRHNSHDVHDRRVDRGRVRCGCSRARDDAHGNGDHSIRNGGGDDDDVRDNRDHSSDSRGRTIRSDDRDSTKDHTKDCTIRSSSMISKPNLCKSRVTMCSSNTKGWSK